MLKAAAVSGSLVSSLDVNPTLGNAAMRLSKIHLTGAALTARIRADVAEHRNYNHQGEISTTCRIVLSLLSPQPNLKQQQTLVSLFYIRFWFQA